MNSYLSALEAAFPLEKLIYCKSCGSKFIDLGNPDIPSHCPICRIINGDTNGTDESRNCDK